MTNIHNAQKHEATLLDDSTLRDFVRRQRKAGKTIGLTSGCFDVLHSAHIELMEESKRWVDLLIVAVNEDSYVHDTKGDDRPILKAADRVRIVRALRAVDAVIRFADETPERLIRQISPDAYFKGRDYEARGEAIPEAVLVKELGGTVCLVGSASAQPSSAIAKRLRDRVSAEFCQEAWRFEADRSTRIKNDEQRWLLFAFATFGSIVGMMFSFKGLGDGFAGISSVDRVALLLGMAAAVHLFGWIWLRQSLTLRKQYYSCRAQVIKYGDALGVAIPGSWRVKPPFASLGKASEGEQPGGKREMAPSEEWRQQATGPRTGKLWEIASVCFLMAVALVVSWVILHPTLLRDGSEGPECALLRGCNTHGECGGDGSECNDQQESTRTDGAPEKSALDQLFFSSFAWPVLVATASWPIFVFGRLDRRNLSAIWEGDIAPLACVHSDA
jgi:D-glycero-beta-D-manno-heptose 1-phosphate adenylyltransferase